MRFFICILLLTNSNLFLFPCRPLQGQDSELSVMKDSIGMDFVKLGKGKKQIGVTTMDEFLEITKDLDSEEQRMDALAILPPLRTIEIINDYWIGIHEVTVGQYRMFVDATKYTTESEKSKTGGTGRLSDGNFGQSPQFNWKNCGIPLTENHPVVNVSWNDAARFCRWMSEKEGVTYRLPTEAEWEHACRAGTRTQFHTGNAVGSLNGFANIADKSLLAEITRISWSAEFDDGVPFLAAVGQFKSNEFGIFDMHGNAGEWCGDRFSFFQPLGKDPTPGSNLRLLKGGHWFGEPTQCGSGVRVGMPDVQCMCLIGFRVVRIDEQ